MILREELNHFSVLIYKGIVNIEKAFPQCVFGRDPPYELFLCDVMAIWIGASLQSSRNWQC